MLVLVDNLNILLNGCYSANELDFLEIMNDFISLTEQGATLALGLNRDLLLDE